MANRLYVLIPIADTFPQRIEDAVIAINSKMIDAKAKLEADYVDLFIGKHSAMLNYSPSVYYWEIYIYTYSSIILENSKAANLLVSDVKKLASALGAKNLYYSGEMSYTDLACDDGDEDEDVFDFRDIDKYSVEMSDAKTEDFKWEKPFIHDTVIH